MPTPEELKALVPLLDEAREIATELEAMRGDVTSPHAACPEQVADAHGGQRDGSDPKAMADGVLRRGRAATRCRFQMREKMIAIGDDYWIEDESGNKVFKVNGKAVRVRDTWVLEDAGGNEVAEIQEKKLCVRDKIKIELGGREATVKKALVGIRDRFHVEVDGGEDLKVHGNIVDHEYEIERDGDKIAEISKKWFRVRDTYGVEVDDEADDGADPRRSPSPSTPSPTTSSLTPARPP